MRTFHNIVDGKPVPAADGRTLDIHDPKTGEVYATSPLSGPADVDAAYKSALRAFENGWGRDHPVGADERHARVRRRRRGPRRRSWWSWRRRTPASRWG